MDLSSLLNLGLLLLGFGFVIFWHELGHFLAAKWAGVKVEQFAVGFGQALLCFRKGIGVRVGTTAGEYARRAREHLQSLESQNIRPEIVSLRSEEHRVDAAARDLGLGETEYRLNWIPLGGYVKMLGQDDMNPLATSPDPRAYNNKPIGKRMVIVSAGVIMNIILAGILFWVLFLMGFRAPAPVAGYVAPGSPAQRAGIGPGDRILTFDGDVMHDFTKVRLTAALVHPEEGADITLSRPDGRTETVRVRAQRVERETGGFLQIGIAPPYILQIDKGLKGDLDPDLAPPELVQFRASDRIAAINGQAVPKVTDRDELSRQQALFHTALQQSAGRPVTLTLEREGGTTATATIRPTLASPFIDEPFNLAGMLPRNVVRSLQAESSARGKLKPGDVIVAMSVEDGTNDRFENPSFRELTTRIYGAGDSGNAITLEVLRNGERITLPGLKPNIRLANKRYGLGFAPGADDAGEPVIAGVLPETPAGRGGLRAGVRVTAVAGQPVANWHDVLAALRLQPVGDVELAVTSDAGSSTVKLPLTEDDRRRLAEQQYTHDVMAYFAERTEVRHTHNPLVALGWGVKETRDLIIQFYVTLKRMLVSQSVSLNQMSGPLGILHSGTIIASRGPDWLVWYLALISANLAVVNFLPIPIVDGGLFVFLLIEKLRGKPVSPRVQTVAQLIGLALILSLFLFVTYNDIVRLL